MASRKAASSASAWLLAGAGAVSMFGPLPARAENAFEKVIVAAQPCRSLKVETGLFTAAIDRIETVDVARLDVSIVDDAASVKGRVLLSCATSDAAVLTGDASVDLEIDAEVNLLDCTVGRLNVRVVETGGSFGDAVDALSPLIVGAVQDGARAELKKLCA